VCVIPWGANGQVDGLDDVGFYRISRLFKKLTVVGHHHGYRSKERLEVVRKFGSSSVAGIHRDESRTGRHQLYLSAFEHEPRQLDQHNTGENTDSRK